jgi:GGDEF domain-containing protein
MINGGSSIAENPIGVLYPVRINSVKSLPAAAIYALIHGTFDGRRRFGDHGPMGAKDFAKGLRVLVVDDEPVIQQFLRLSLESMGFEVEIFGTLETITARCQKTDFDLVIVDKNLPDGSGLTLCKKLVDDKIDCELVVISGYANVASAVEAIRLGVADYVVKPVDLEDFSLRISRVVDYQKLKRGNRQLMEELRQKNEELAGMVVRDPLTRLFNHSYLQEALQREVARSVQHGYQFSLVLIDIDRFKEINNSMGHMTGDDVLHKFASFLQTGSRRNDIAFRLRRDDIAARYAGDVFSLLLPRFRVLPCKRYRPVSPRFPKMPPIAKGSYWRPTLRFQRPSAREAIKSSVTRPRWVAEVKTPKTTKQREFRPLDAHSPIDHSISYTNPLSILLTGRFLPTKGCAGRPTI